MNRTLLFLFLINIATQVHAMKRRYEQAQPTTISTNFLYYTQLPLDIQNVIIDFCTLDTLEKKPKNATKTVRALAVTNKALNAFINDQHISDKIIENFTHKFYCSHETIAKYLATKKAKERLQLQTQLKELCLYNSKLFALDKLNKIMTEQLTLLIKKGINLEFTYIHQYSPKTPLMLAMGQKNSLFQLLLEKADINTHTSHGLTILKAAIEYPINRSAYQQLLTKKSININHQNRCGESTLLHTLINRKKVSISHTFIRTIKRLLDAGADPELANKHGLTPLYVAQELNNEEIIEDIKQAIIKKHS